MKINDKYYLILLSTFTAFGPKRIKLLMDYFGDTKSVWQLTKSKLMEVGIKETIADNFINHRKTFNSDLYFDKLEKLKIDCISIKESSYPENLRGIDDAPVLLYVIGDLSKKDINSVAIVGSRRMTSYGREVATKFSTELSAYGITIVSGLALGIDSIAQKAAIDAGGRCIAVIASGLDKITPYSNLRLAHEIAESGGAVISESPLGAPIYKNSFPIRNRIISGLSKAVVVIEGAEKSGTLLTASHAANQGRTVFAVPGQITSPLSGAPLFLLRNGAKMITSSKDILDELDLEVKVDRGAFLKVFPENAEEQKIFEILQNEPMHIDEIVRITGVEISRTSSLVMTMQLKGMIKDLGGGVYKRI